MADATSPAFAQVAQQLEGVEGWLTLDQARALYDAAADLPPRARVVEIGSFRGRSTIVLGLAAPPDAEVVAIDPHAGNDRGPNELVGFEAEAATDHDVFLANLADAGLTGRVRHVRAFSSDALDQVRGPIDLLYIDGAHRYGPARDDIRRWGKRVAEGGELCIHDSFSSVGVTLALATTLVVGRRFRYLGRSGSLARYRAVAPARGLDRLTNAARQVGELPWFARNLAIKVLIAARLGRFTRLLGHRDPTWPY